jgi:hypothetical protein
VRYLLFARQKYFRMKQFEAAQSKMKLLKCGSEPDQGPTWPANIRMTDRKCMHIRLCVRLLAALIIIPQCAGVTVHGDPYCGGRSRLSGTDDFMSRENRTYKWENRTNILKQDIS